MRQLTQAVQEAWPPNKYSGWALVLRNCAKSKQCTMCPHNMLWRKYYGKKTFLWARGADAYATILPVDKLYCSKQKRKALVEAEVLRLAIMEKHTSLVRLKSMLDHKRQGLVLSRKKELGDDFIQSLYRIMIDIVADYKTPRAEIEMRIQAFVQANPSYKGNILISQEQRALKRKIHYASKAEKKRMGIM